MSPRYEKCSTCGMVLLWAVVAGESALVCPRASCPGDAREMRAGRPPEDNNTEARP
jgi:hypothetical protein